MRALPFSRSYLQMHNRRRLLNLFVVGLTLLIAVQALFPIFWIVLGSVRPVAEVLAYPPQVDPRRVHAALLRDAYHGAQVYTLARKLVYRIGRHNCCQPASGNTGRIWVLPLQRARR